MKQRRVRVWGVGGGGKGDWVFFGIFKVVKGCFVFPLFFARNGCRIAWLGGSNLVHPVYTVHERAVVFQGNFFPRMSAT